MTPYSSPSKSLFSFIDIDGTDRNTSHQSSTKKPMYSQHVQNKVLFVSSYIAKNKEPTIKGRRYLLLLVPLTWHPRYWMNAVWFIMNSLGGLIAPEKFMEVGIWTLSPDCDWSFCAFAHRYQTHLIFRRFVRFRGWAEKLLSENGLVPINFWQSLELLASRPASCLMISRLLDTPIYRSCGWHFTMRYLAILPGKLCLMMWWDASS